MTYEASPPRSRFPRLVARLIVCVGAIIAIWLLAPTAANALEPSAAPEDPLADAVDETAGTAESTVTEVVGTVTDAVDETADTAKSTVTEVAGTVTDAVDETAVTAESTVTEAAGDLTDAVGETAGADGHAKTARGAVSSVADDIARSARGPTARVEDLAGDPVSTLDEAGKAATDVAGLSLDPTPTVDLDGLSTVAATVGAVTAEASGSPVDRDRFAEFALRERILSSRSGDDLALPIRGPPIMSGIIHATTISDGGAHRTSSPAGSTPAGSHHLPAIDWSSSPRSPGDGPSFNDFAAILAALTIALCLGRWSVRAAELGYPPIFLPLAERPG